MADLFWWNGSGRGRTTGFASAAWALLGLAIGGCSTSAPGSDPVNTALRERFPEHASTVLAGPLFATDAEGFRGETLVSRLGLPGDERDALATEPLVLVLPFDGSDAVRLRLGADLDVRVVEQGVYGPGQQIESAVAYPREGGTSYWARTADGFEEWLHLDAGVAWGSRKAVSWRVQGAAIAMQGDSVLLTNESGVPRVRVSAPAAYAMTGEPVMTRLGVEGDTITLTVDAEGQEVLVDPSWTSTSSMSSAREVPTATALLNGDVLLVAGLSGGGISTTSEEYDHTLGVWTTTAQLQTPRYFHTATLLTDGGVLLAGGIAGAQPNFLATAEVYDPAVRAWMPAGSSSQPLYGRAAAALSGARALVMGGKAPLAGPATTIAELYQSNTWTTVAPMGTGRAFHTATALADGRVLVTGGHDPSSLTLSSAEIYDPTTDTWAPAAPMSKPRAFHYAVRLDDGRVLVVAGTSGGLLTATCEIYDPASGTWSPTGSLHRARTQHAATILANGRVLVAGGHAQYADEATVESYNPATGEWQPAGTMTTSRYGAAAAPLPQNKAIIAGGYKSGALKSADILQ